MDGRKDAVEQIAAESHLGQLEGDCTGVTHNPRTNLYQSRLQTFQLPVDYLIK